MNPVGLPPRVLLWADGAEADSWLQTLRLLLREPACWAGVDVFTPLMNAADARRLSQTMSKLDEQGSVPVVWHGPVAGWEEALCGVTLPDGVPLAWLNAGTRVPLGWVEPLQKALLHEPALGTCSPVAMGDAMHAPFFDATRTDADVDTLSTWLRAHAPAETLELGVPLACAGMMRHEAWQAVRPGVPWALAVARAGWLHGTSRQVAVAVPMAGGSVPAAERVASSTAEVSHDGRDGRAFSLIAEAALWRNAHPLTGLRHALSQVPPGDLATSDEGAPQRLSQPGAPSVRLHVLHSWGGGLSKWVGDFCRGDVQAGTGRNLLLKSVGTHGAFAQRLELHADHDGGAPLQVWELGLPIHATALAHGQFQRVLDEVIERYGVSEVIVSSLIGHSLDVLRTGLPTVLVMHDHHPFCVTLYAHFEGECRQCDSQRLAQCMRENPGHRFFQGVHAEDWEALRRAFVSTVVRHRPVLVAPSTSVAERWRSLMPGLADIPMRVIEHGLALVPAPAFEPPADGLLRVVVLGRLTAEKGRGLLAEIVPALRGNAEVLLMGCGDQQDPLKALAHVTAVEHFDAAELPARLAAWQPHVGLLLSTVPETFSYALSELWHTRIPVLASAHGALADRIRDGENGFLVEPSATAVLERLAYLHSHREILSAVRQRLGTQSTRDLQAMVSDYLRELRPLPRRRPARFDVSSVVSLAPPTEPTARGSGRWLHVSPEATWWQACLGFWDYTRRKAAHSPRLPKTVRRWLIR
jgi:glycosyltransferase involved in cell wall biosynthesis